MTFDGKVAHLWPDQCEGEDPLRAGGQGGRAGWAGGRVAGAASAATAAAAAAQVRSAAHRAAKRRSKSSRMLKAELLASIWRSAEMSAPRGSAGPAFAVRAVEAGSS